MLLKGLPKRHSLSILSEHLNSALSLLTSTPGTRALQLTEPLIKTSPVPLLQSERRGPGLLLGTSSKAHTHNTARQGSGQAAWALPTLVPGAFPTCEGIYWETTNQMWLYFSKTAEVSSEKSY